MLKCIKHFWVFHVETILRPGEGVAENVHDTFKGKYLLYIYELITLIKMMF